MLAGLCEKRAFSGTHSHSDSIGFCFCRRSVRAAPSKPAVRVTMDSPESGKGGNGDRSFSSDTLSQVSRVSQVSQDSLEYNPELSSSVVDQTLSDSVFARSEDDDFDSLEPEQAGVKDGSHGDPPPRRFQGDGGEESDGRQRPWLLNDRSVVPRTGSGLRNCADYAGSSATGRQHLGPVRGAWTSVNNNSDRLLQSPFGSNNNSDRLLQSPFDSNNSDRLLQSPFGQQNSSALQSLSLECVSACGRNCGSGSPAQPSLCPADGSRSHCAGSALTRRVCGPRGWGTSDWSKPGLWRPRVEDEYLADDELDSSGYAGRGGSALCGPEFHGPGFHGPCETGDGQERGLHEVGGGTFVLSDRGVGVTLSSAVVSGPTSGGDHGPSATGCGHSAAHTRGARVPQTFSSGERLQEPRLHRSVNDHRFHHHHHHHLAGDRPWHGAKSPDPSHSSQRAAQPPHQGDPTGHDGCGATPHPGRSKLAPARWDARGLFSSRPLVPGFESPSSVPGFESPSSVSGRSSVDTAEEVAAELPPLAAGSGIVVEGSGVVVELGAGFACGGPPANNVGVADSEGLSSGSARRVCRGRPLQAGDGDAVHANNDRPGSAGDRPGSTGNRPGSAGDRPGSTGNRPGYAGDRLGFVGNGPGSAGDRPGYAGDRPGYAGDRPGCAGDRPGCAGGVCRDHRWDAVDVDAVHTVGLPGQVDAGAVDVDGVHSVGLPGQVDAGAVDVDAVHSVGLPGQVDAGAVHAVDMPGSVGAVVGGRVPDAVDVDAGRAVDAGGTDGVPGEAVGAEDSGTGTTSECSGLCSPGAYDPQLVSASP